MLNADRDAAEPAESASDVFDRFAIRELLENWVVWRDAGDWERFATVWHAGGRMNATWFQADAADFIAGCRRVFEAGAIGVHSLGGMSIDVNGLRAFAQTKMQIVQRGTVHGVEVDVICQGRFFDALELREGRWGMVLRQPVYELDRMVPVAPGNALALDLELLASYPTGYRHLAYLQVQMGFDVEKSLPGTRGSEVDALNSRMRRWLKSETNSLTE